MPIPSIEATLSLYAQHLYSVVRTRPLIVASAVGAAVPLISYMVQSYRGYLALPPGGIPKNLFGWAVQACLRPLSRGDVIETAPYSDPSILPRYAPHGRTSFLGDDPLPPRRGGRPTVPSYVAPHRQTTEMGDERLVERMNEYLAALARANPTLLEIRPSGLEGKSNPALFLKGQRAELPRYLARGTAGEVAHVHTEASSHLVLSLVDAETATSQGWAERHRLSGAVFHVLPLSYVIVYAPRDDEELAVWKRLVSASIDFTTAGSGSSARLGG